MQFLHIKRMGNVLFLSKFMEILNEHVRKADLLSCAQENGHINSSTQ